MRLFRGTNVDPFPSQRSLATICTIESTLGEPFSTLICVDATKFVLLNVFTLKETICSGIYFKITTEEYKKSTSD